jgi:uncharacterized repeat protein (TIGR01451 family)
MTDHRGIGLFWAGLPLAAALLFVWGLFLLLPVPEALAGRRPAAPAANPLRISQVYGGGGNSSALYTHDFIELFNAGSASVDLTGWSVQYASSAGSTWQVTPLGSVTLQPGMYLLIQEAAGNTGGTTPLPPADATGTIAMSATAGKVALVSSTTALDGGCPIGTGIMDFVGYGDSASCFETNPTPNLSNPTSTLRKAEGCVDTDNNAADFSLSNPPTPRNRLSPIHLCAAASSPAITKLAPPFVTIGSAFAYTITVRNDMAIDLLSVAVSDTLPAGVSFASASAGGVFDGRSVHWAPGSLAAGTSFQASFVVTASLTPTLAVNGAYTVTAANFLTPTVGAPVSTIIDDRLHIHTLQGAGAASPFASRYVQGVVGVVTSVQPDGFFMQDPEPDADPATSEGIFVSTGSSVGVTVGQAAAVWGNVIEQDGLTELVRTALAPSPTTTVIAPTLADLPVPADLEPYEGMLVTFPEALTVSQNYFQGRYGQVTLSTAGRLFHPNDGNGLGDTPDYNRRRMIVLDDNTRAQNPNPIPYIGQDDTLRAGDIVTGLTGVVDYGPIYSDSLPRYYRLQPTLPPVFTRLNPRSPASPLVEGNLRVAGFNVYNYFNGDGLGGGFPTPRGASSLAEFIRQRSKVIAVLAALDADIVGLVEIENDGDGQSSAIQDLVGGLNTAVGNSAAYAFIPDPADTGSDAIKVALIYKPARVTPMGSPLSGADPIFSRPPLAQTFRLTANGGELTVVVNHFKSKGCDGAVGLELDYGQGCFNHRRVLQAQALLAFINSLKASRGDPDVLAIGDYNAYGAEDPIQTLVAGGLSNLALAVPATDRYSYVFDGQSGYLDHALATASLASQVGGMAFWHINADEPAVLDYNLEFKTQDLYTPTPYRSSDHDPAVVGIRLAEEHRVRLPLVLR